MRRRQRCFEKLDDLNRRFEDLVRAFRGRLVRGGDYPATAKPLFSCSIMFAVSTVPAIPPLPK